jgi:hypothetical protein
MVERGAFAVESSANVRCGHPGAAYHPSVSGELTPATLPPRLLVLPRRGRALVSTDMHGNGDDFRRLCALFRALSAKEPDLHWVVLGDAVHGPNLRARRTNPEFYDFDDESWEIVAGLMTIAREREGRVHYVLGNHDYGHIGGMHTSKFFDDEVENLESKLSAANVERLRAYFRQALLAVVAPCGALLSHGSPDARLAALADLDRIALPPAPGDNYGCQVVRAFLTCYGQRREISEQLLSVVSAAGTPIVMVLHGHDRAEEGWFVEGGNQGCPVLFGALRENKRVVLLDLETTYASIADLREGHEILRLHGAEVDAIIAAGELKGTL